jgi:hypothetical protein
MLSPNSRLSCILALNAVFGGGCSSLRRTELPDIGTPMIATGMGRIGSGKPLDITVKTPELNWNILDLDLEDFIPPGARKIEGSSVYPELFEEAHLAFDPPTSITLSSPNFEASISMASSTGNAINYRWLTLKEKGSDSIEPIYITGKSIHAYWSPRSDRIALNYWPDSYSREFALVTRGNPERLSFDLSPLISRYFPTSGAARSIAKVHRWTKQGDLVVRCLTQKMEEPFPVFGCEVQIVLTGNIKNPPQILLRGFYRD